MKVLRVILITFGVALTMMGVFLMTQYEYDLEQTLQGFPLYYLGIIALAIGIICSIGSLLFLIQDME